ncbi:S24 family peptidase [Thiofilum flexile]|uniref:S24 family peptidase n=1 Tax=Thiofilum flexile TaxID=125627 RepID=UPI00036061D7|nr:S24 family peptidase [Thiofilum flexile]
MNEVRLSVEQAFKQHDLIQGLSEGSSCSEAEPFALQVLDDSMEPEFNTGCIIIIDPSGHAKEGAFVFAKDNQGEYIFRRLRRMNNEYFLEPLNPVYETLKISGLNQISGVITQRAGKRRSYHKWYD